MALHPQGRNALLRLFFSPPWYLSGCCMDVQLRLAVGEFGVERAICVTYSSRLKVHDDRLVAELRPSVSGSSQSAE
jgi:hypothetical protein